MHIIADNKGLTLVELVISVAIIVIVLSGVSSLYYTSRQSTATIWSDLEAQRDARRVTQEVRNYARRANIANNGAYPIDTASSSLFIFYADIDSDGLVERVRYEYATTTLLRGIIKPTGTPYTYDTATEDVATVARGVRNIQNGVDIFEYFDENYATTGTPLAVPVDITEVRTVRVYLQVDEDTTSPPSLFDVSTAVHIRNLKEN